MNILGLVICSSKRIVSDDVLFHYLSVLKFLSAKNVINLVFEINIIKM